MIKNLFKKITSKLPKRYQQELKRMHFGRQLRKGVFVSDEKEYELLDRWINEGDWVIDVGANIGHYTSKFSRLVGRNGRVIAFEPIPETFELLAANTARFPFSNVTLINAGASDASSLKGMLLPKFSTGLNNYYMAQITDDNSSIDVHCFAIDSFGFPGHVTLVKIDAEGHDLHVLIGMKHLLEKHHPVIIIEDASPDIDVLLNSLGYTYKRIENSHNRVFTTK